MDEHNPARASGDVVPIPDPTRLTMEEIKRECNALDAKITARIDAMDKAMDLFRDDLTRFPTDLDRQIQCTRDVLEEKLRTAETDRNAIENMIGALQALHDERFKSIAVQFTERDTRADQAAKDSKQALDAALVATKEAFALENKNSTIAIAKSESSVAKQIDTLSALLGTNTHTLDEKINDLKERMTRIESMGLGAKEQKAEQHSNVGLMVSIAVAAVSVIGLVITLVTVFGR